MLKKSRIQQRSPQFVKPFDPPEENDDSDLLYVIT